jgi:hypothetical protein
MMAPAKSNVIQRRCQSRFCPQHCLQDVNPRIRNAFSAPVRAVRLDAACRAGRGDGAHVAITPVRGQAADLHHLEGGVVEDCARYIQETVHRGMRNQSEFQRFRFRPWETPSNCHSKEIVPKVPVVLLQWICRGHEGNRTFSEE